MSMMSTSTMPDTADVASIVQWALAGAMAAPRRKPLPWSEQEDDFLRLNLGFLSEEEIAQHVGRTWVAVRLRWKRDLGLPAPTKTPGYVTANQAAKMLDKDVHAVCHWIRRGWLPAHLLPFRNGRMVWRIRVEDLKRFAVKPEHWILFRPERVRDPHLARLVALAVERWGDEWLAPGQVAAMHDVRHTDVNRFIRAGRLPAVKWGNWWIRRSDADLIYFPKGRGSGHELDWSEEGDAFMILARAVGLSLPAIGGLMSLPKFQVSARLTMLHRRGEIPWLIGKYDLEGVRYRSESGRLLAEWWLYRGRFPTLAQAMDRFAAGETLSPVQAACVRGVLWTWAAFRLGRTHPLTRRLLTTGQGRGRELSPSRLPMLYRELRGLGVDPLPWRRLPKAGPVQSLT